MEILRSQLSLRARRLVVKVGSGVLSAGSTRLDIKTIRRLARELAGLKAEGRELLLVSSGAILAGSERLALKARPASIELKQASAAVGQSRLMRAWEEAFDREGLTVAQILLTREDLRDRRRYLNARNTASALLRLGVVPIINENDTVAVEEIQFGDNDVLSALAASLVGADLLILLTDQDGLYDRDPRNDARARLIPVVGSAGVQAATERAGPRGTGGMGSKVSAARMAACAGIPAVIANGGTPGTLKAVIGGRGVGTLFLPRGTALDKRRQWLAFASHPKGAVHVDAGAREALLRRSKSLLPSGVLSVSKSFEAGDVVSLVHDGAEFARGLTNFGSRELALIKGLKTSLIEGALGRKAAGEVVHRDNMAPLGEP